MGKLRGRDNNGDILTHADCDFSSDPEYCFWESEVYTKLKSCRFFKRNLFKYLDDGIAFYVLFSWVRNWIGLVSKQYVEPFKFYPLPISDQILYWQPIFSKHVSDSLLKWDVYETQKSQCATSKKNKPAKFVFIKALFITFWRRFVIIILGNFILNLCSILTTFIIKKILDLVSETKFNFVFVLSLVTLLALLQFFIGIFLDHLNFYMYRLIHVVQYCFSITVFQHGFCYRRKFSNEINGSNSLNVCNSVLHSCSPDSNCSKNPLYCPARRYQNRDINSSIFTYHYADAYYISTSFESIKFVVEFLCNFIYGVILMSFQIKVNLWVLYVVGVCFLLLIVIVEIINSVVMNFILYIRDNRVTESREIFSLLHLIHKNHFNDIAINVITALRNNELCLFFIRVFLIFLNMSLYTICVNICYYILVRYFVKTIDDADVITGIDTAGFMATVYVFVRIIDSMFLIPYSVLIIGYCFVSYNRLKLFINHCSPNFYICDNKYTGSTVASTNNSEVGNVIPVDTVVYFKDASFSWVNSRKDLLSMNYQPYLRNVDFELKRGEIAVVTGSQGSGKSNFIKSVLGEMTLVGGSMAVVPLHTDMPIFYASQDIWLHQGTIRSNITFGYKFDEEIYSTVLKAVEITADISTWEGGDLRVVSNYAHSLSGGQRVRMEMARALYAYLIFNKVNREYNNNQCSFLMCLDAPFHGLDPFVSKLIFNNLFNVESGLLVKGDLSVILSIYKRFFDSISTTVSSLPKMSLYQIENQTLEKLGEVFGDSKRALFPRSHQIAFLTPKDIIEMCGSGRNKRELRAESVKSKYEDSLIIDPKSKAVGRKFRQSFKPYVIYLKSIGPLFLLFVLLTSGYVAFENFTYGTVGDMGDDIMEIVININSKLEGVSSYTTIKKICNDAIHKIRNFAVVIVILCFFSNAVLTFTCLRGCKRIHEYCINSLINSSSSVVRIKKFSSEVLTFLASDVFMIDENFGPCLSSLIILFVIVLVQSFIVIYYFPVCIPAVILGLFIIVNYIFKDFLHASKNLQIASLESLSRNNFVCENAVSSSSTYRSFKKESTLLDGVMEYTDYGIRSWFYSKSFLSWASFVSKFVFLFMNIFNFTFPVIYKKYKGFKSFVGFFGLNMMQGIRMMFSFTSFVITIAKLEMFMCSIKRFECFVPPGEKCVFEKYRNIHEEDVLVNLSSKDQPSVTELRASLLSRRKREFKEENARFYAFKRVGFKPKLNFIDVAKYVEPEHSGVKLKDVYVYTSPEMREEGIILRGITVSAKRSDIIGIIGRTGAGKTTLLSVLENTMGNRVGQVLLDGRDLKDIPKNVTRQIIGVLPQLPFVFKGWTIRRFIDPRKLFTDDEINQALDNCGLLGFVNNLQGGKKLDSVIIPDNLKSYMPTGSVTSLNAENLKDYYEACDMLLSNTQLRTVSFARLVLYRKFYRMVLVDEPPSENCDSEYLTNTAVSEDLGVPIYQLLKRYFQHCTTFVTAHDSNALRACNSVWVLHNGSFMGRCGVGEILKDNSISDIIQKFVRNDSNPRAL